MLTIGSDRKRVKSLVDDLTGSIKDKQDAPEIIGIVVSITHDSYEMYCQDNEEPLFFVCDRVAKCLEKDQHGRFVSAQICDESPLAKRPKHEGS